MLESRTPISDAIRDRRLPVPVDNLPSATRLALILFDIDQVAARAGQERALRLGNERIIREALTYAPPFAREIAEDLSATRILLISNGFIPEDREKSEIGLAKAVDEALREYGYRPKVVNPFETTRDIARRIAMTVHPDVAGGNVGQILPVCERNDTLATALMLGEAAEGEKAQQLLIETMPRLYLHQIRDMLAQGMTFAEIVVANPEMIPDLENLRWVAAHRLPKEREYRRFSDPEEVEQQAARIRRKNEHHARTAGYTMVYGITRDVLKFAESKGLKPLGYATEHLLKYMEETGGYIGGTGEFVFQRGVWVESMYARILAGKMEGSIKALPHALHYVAEVVIAPDTTTESFNKALEELKSVVANVKSRAEQYGGELEDTANRRSTPSASLNSNPLIINKLNSNFKNFK